MASKDNNRKFAD
jgi:hypothetical protein